MLCLGYLGSLDGPLSLFPPELDGFLLTVETVKQVGIALCRCGDDRIMRALGEKFPGAPYSKYDPQNNHRYAPWPVLIDQTEDGGDCGNSGWFHYPATRCFLGLVCGEAVAVPFVFPGSCSPSTLQGE